MARSSQQKAKLLYVRSFLLENSDEEHPQSIARIIDFLRAQGIDAERKSIYDDFETLRHFGLDIQLTRQPQTGYFVGQRPFELAELKLLVDAVQSCKFITERKTAQLIRKLAALASAPQAEQLRRQVFTAGRVKSMNESVYYIVDALHAAINGRNQVSFRYFDYAVDKRRRFRRNGASYQVSPFALLWDDQRYYLLAWDGETSQLRHYRIDRMLDLRRLEQPRQGEEAFAGLDLSRYTEQTFDMFAGQRQLVTLEFDDRLAGAALDRFGKDVLISRSSAGSFTVDVPVAVSSHFYAWVMGFDGGCRVLGPPEVRQGLLDQINRLRAQYL